MSKPCKFPTATVAAGDKVIEVRHLTLSDIAELRRKHAASLFEAIDTCKPLLLQEAGFQRTYGALVVLLELADAVSDVITLASGRRCDFELARSLPFHIQVKALIEILELTFATNPIDGFAPELLEALAELQNARPEEVN